MCALTKGTEIHHCLVSITLYMSCCCLGDTNNRSSSLKLLYYDCWSEFGVLILGIRCYLAWGGNFCNNLRCVHICHIITFYPNFQSILPRYTAILLQKHLSWQITILFGDTVMLSDPNAISIVINVWNCIWLDGWTEWRFLGACIVVVIVRWSISGAGWRWSMHYWIVVSENLFVLIKVRQR